MNGEESCWSRHRVNRRLVLGGFLLLTPALSASARSYKEFAEQLVANPPTGSAFRSDIEGELLTLTNAYRAAKGLSRLAADEVFLTAARAQAADMMINNFIGHRASDGTPFERRLRALAGNIQRFGTVGENAARDSQKTPVNGAKAASLFQQWVDSRPHRANLKKPDYAYLATGVAQRGNTIWAIQIFRGEERKGLLFGGATINGKSAAPSQ